MIISGHIQVPFAKKKYSFTQKAEVEHFFRKIHLCVGYPPSGEDFVKKWVVDEKN
jgi:hypothetical protein